MSTHAGNEPMGLLIPLMISLVVASIGVGTLFYHLNLYLECMNTTTDSWRCIVSLMISKDSS